MILYDNGINGIGTKGKDSIIIGIWLCYSSYTLVVHIHIPYVKDYLMLFMGG